MRTYIESCIDRVTAAALSSPSFNKPKRYIQDYPICLMGFVDKRKSHSLREPLLVDELPRITISENSLWPYAPILITSRILINEQNEAAASITQYASNDHFYYRHDLAYHYESTVSKSLVRPHDFTVPVRYCWFLPVRHFKPIFFEEVDFVLYRILHDETLCRYVLPGVIQQLAKLGGYDELWVTTMTTMLLMLPKWCQARQLSDKTSITVV